jgi:hypothetical protein
MFPNTQLQSQVRDSKGFTEREIQREGGVEKLGNCQIKAVHVIILA